MNETIFNVQLTSFSRCVSIKSIHSSNMFEYSFCFIYVKTRSLNHLSIAFECNLLRFYYNSFYLGWLFCVQCLTPVTFSWSGVERTIKQTISLPFLRPCISIIRSIRYLAYTKPVAKQCSGAKNNRIDDVSRTVDTHADDIVSSVPDPLAVRPLHRDS